MSRDPRLKHLELFGDPRPMVLGFNSPKLLQKCFKKKKEKAKMQKKINNMGNNTFVPKAP